MKIAFAGHKNAFDFFKIGGTDALVRRIALCLAQTQPVFILTYCNAAASREEIAPGIFLIRCTSFQNLLETVTDEGISDVITIYFRASDRLRLITYRSPVTYHTVLTTYNSALWKRWGLFASSVLCFGGAKFCISKRIKHAMSRISSRAVLLWPPVDDDFFTDANTAPAAKAKERSKTRIAYMGRLDWGKGADLAIEFFERTSLSPEAYEFYVYAYPWRNDPFSLKLHTHLQNHPTITYVEAKLVDDLDRMDARLRASIDETDVFVLPYREMLSTIDSPLVPMEIAARGKPLVTTDIEGLPTLPIRGAKYLSLQQAADPQKLEEAIVALCAASAEAPDQSYSASAVTEVIFGTLGTISQKQKGRFHAS